MLHAMNAKGKSFCELTITNECLNWRWKKSAFFSPFIAAQWLFVCKPISISLNDEIHVYINHMNQQTNRARKKYDLSPEQQNSSVNHWMESNGTFFSFRLQSDMQSIYSRDLPKWNIIVSICSKISFVINAIS